MIKELNKDYKPNWDEKIEIGLTLRELQLIYDCVGVVPFKYINYKHEASDFYNQYSASIFSDMYDSLNDILNFHNGITDDNVSVNNDAYLEIVNNGE